MTRRPTPSIDVRDMLCAQALALVSDAVARLPIGEAVLVYLNTEDVRRDLEIWARDRGHPVRLESSERLTIQRVR